MAAPTQAQRLRAKIAASGISAPARTGTGPEVILPSVLSRHITREQEQDILSHCRARLETLMNEQGRVNYGAPDFYASRSESGLRQNVVTFMGRQHLAHMVYQSELDWREWVLGGIWKESNIHFPLTRRIVQQQIARGQTYFTGTEPFFSAFETNPEPSDTEGEDKAEKVERYARFEADQSNQQELVNEAILLAFIQGQQVVKTVHESNVEFYRTTARVMFSGGKPVIGQDGDYIFETDAFVQAPQALPLPAGAVVPAQMVLKRDMTTVKPADAEFKEQDIVRTLKHFQGAKSTCLNFLDFLCPLTAPSVDDADCVVHITNEPVVSLFHRLLESGEWEKQKVGADEQLSRMMELLERLGPGIGESERAGAKQGDPAMREAENASGADRNEPEAALCEFYLHYDLGNGEPPASILVITDIHCRVPVFYDYLANVTWNGKRPFSVYRVNPVPNRWHGQSQVELFWPIQYAIDLFLNRMHLAVTSAGRIDFWNPDLIVEGAANPNLELNWGRSYKLKTNARAEDALKSVYLQTVNFGEFRALIEMLIQIAVNMSGIANANDARAANLDTGKTATGINQIEQSGQELFRAFTSALTPGVRDHMRSFVHVTLRHLDETRVFQFFDGDAGVLASITPQEVRDIDLDITLELTRFKAAQLQEKGDAAWRIAVEFYQMHPEVQVRLAPLARQRLKATGTTGADEMIGPLMPPPPQP